VTDPLDREWIWSRPALDCIVVEHGPRVPPEGLGVIDCRCGDARKLIAMACQLAPTPSGVSVYVYGHNGRFESSIEKHEQLIRRMTELRDRLGPPPPPAPEPIKRIEAIDYEPSPKYSGDPVPVSTKRIARLELPPAAPRSKRIAGIDLDPA